VLTPGTVDESNFEGLRILHEHDEERHRFSALPLGEGRVLVTANAPATASAVAAIGKEVVPIDVSEIQAADGGLTCMSILF
jgi:dimethylargininase